MPGVPKSRGCEACRKQRKKCDQRQPACSRCARLFIPCTGGGVQRYVFHDNSGPGGKAKQLKQLLSRRDAIINAPTQAIDSIPPPNSQDSMTALMINKFSITDLRYDVGWAFGSFIHEIPRRVGHSVALDFAARTFALTLPPSPHARRHPGSDVLENFAVALKETRLALADPVASKSINTLCAAYLITLCTDRIGAPEELSIHIAGVSHMLNSREADFDPSNEFDATLVMMLCSIINAEKTLDTRLETSQSSPFWQFFNACKMQSMGPIQKQRSDLALYADLSRSLEALLTLTHEIRPASETLIHFAGIASIIRQYRANWQQSCTALSISTENPESLAEGSHHSPETLRTHLRSVRDYGAALALGIVMNMIVRTYFPSQEHALSQTARNFTAELITCAKQATRFKPLGGAFMSPFLHTVWAAGDHDSRMALTSTLHLHEIDFDPRNAKFLSARMNTVFQNMRSRIAAQSLSRAMSSSGTATPLPDLRRESTVGLQRESEMPVQYISSTSSVSARGCELATPFPDPPLSSTGLPRELATPPIQQMSWTTSLPTAGGRELPTPDTIIGNCSD